MGFTRLPPHSPAIEVIIKFMEPPSDLFVKLRCRRPMPVNDVLQITACCSACIAALFLVATG